MLIRFLQDYRGVLTEEIFFTAGSEADLPNGSDLVEAGRAEAVEEEAAAAKPTTKKTSKKK